MASTIPYAVKRLDCDGKIHGGSVMSWKQVAEQLRWLFWNQTVPIAMKEVGTTSSASLSSSSGSDAPVTSVDGNDQEEGAPKDVALAVMAGSVALLFLVAAGFFCVRCARTNSSSHLNAHTRLAMELADSTRGERAVGDILERYKDYDGDDWNDITPCSE